MPKSPQPQTKADSQGPLGVAIDLVFNLVLPVYILEKFSHRLGENGAVWALVIALSFPLGFGLYDYIVNKKQNWASILGFVNTVFTGVFAVIGLTRNWYIVKEIIVPLILGIYVLMTLRKGSKPFIEKLIYNDRVLNIALIEERLRRQNQIDRLHSHLAKSTQYFSASFFLSAILNFLVANHVFTDIEYFWLSSERAALRNLQIAQMTKLGYLMIALPCMVITMVVIWFLLNGLTKITKLSLNEIMADRSPHSASASPSTSTSPDSSS
ncbi:MAG: VC0807 family protein [Pseudomonadota bacterium]|nr:VC0807 family protein [Pseudomonadota bacterium]